MFAVEGHRNLTWSAQPTNNTQLTCRNHGLIYNDIGDYRTRA
jgi:hypothetical protein